jgi:transcriptional regulator with GAF, ATPase, and Fis domain
MRDWGKILLSMTGGLAVFYCVAAQVFVVTNPDLRIRATLTDEAPPGSGVIVQATPSPDNCIGVSAPPEPGDLLFSVNGERVHNFSEFARSLVKLRYAGPLPGGTEWRGTDPDELPRYSMFSLVEIEGGKRYTRIRFFRQTGTPGEWEQQASSCWVGLQSMPMRGLILTMVWLVPQLFIFSFGAMAYWSRPSDRRSRLFFVLSFLTLVAFVGGSHWWVVAGSAWLAIPFAVSAVLLPAVLLHLFLVYPTPKSFVLLWPRIVPAALYAVPGTLALLLVSGILGMSLTSGSFVEGPFGRMWGGLLGSLTSLLLHAARMTVQIGVVVAGIYFALTMLAIVHAYRRMRSVAERQQMQWILGAGSLAVVPVAYTLYLAFFHRVELALGGAQVPMILASLCFMLAFGVGMFGPKLSLLGGSISQGMTYYVVSAGLAATYALLIAAGSLLALNQEVARVDLDRAIAVTISLMLTIVVLSWLRDRVQRWVDRRFFEEKYQLGKALDRMNQAVTGLWDRETLADQMLDSCCHVLGVERAACYFRSPQEQTFRRISTRGTPGFPGEIEAKPLLLLSLRDGRSLQRVRAGSSVTQGLLRSVGAELIHGLSVDGEMVGLIVMGPKPNAVAFTSEDVTFLTAFERVAGLALHFAKVHDEFGRLSTELQLKVERIGEQERQISLLERQLNLHSQTRVEPETSEFQAPQIIGRSPAMQQVLQTVRKVAASDSSVLVRGESGTGKELLARAIHDNSPRRDGPMVSLHCAALAPTLLESELFGHARGAFTDAREDKIGRFQLADGGTLFLDEIGDISADVQVKLLRVLQQRTFEPVGSHRTVEVDVRVVAATHRNLEELIAAGKFREDLYYRLNVITVTIPPLRERKDDLLDLAMHFLARANRRTGKSVTHIDESAHTLLMQHSWPGNIRELENLIERAVVLAEGNRITAAELPQDVLSPRRLPQQVVDVKPATAISRPESAAPDWVPQEVSRRTSGTPQERQQLVQALARANGNKARAARLLGLPRSTFCSKLKKHDLE